MIVNPGDWGKLWELVEEDFNASSEKGVSLLFSVQEVETVCALKMLQLALAKHNVRYDLYPVEHCTGLRNTLHVLLQKSLLERTLVLINCGACDFIQDLAPESAANVRFIIVDSHRPVHPKYNNDDDSDHFLLLADDDPLQLQSIPVCSELDDLAIEDREQLRADAEAEQEREADQDEDSPSKRARLEGDEDTPQTNRRYYRERYKQLRERERQLEEYYSMGSSFGKPTPLLMLPLTEQLMGKLDNQLLWPAAVGLTDQWVHQRLSNVQYNCWNSVLQEQVKAHDTNRTAFESAANNGSAPLYVNVAITVDKELRLMLHRHWNMFDSFCYSSYVAPRLQTWRAGGEEAVALLFAQMGISQQQAKTAYKSMQTQAKQHFREKLQGALANTSLVYSELAVDGFVMKFNREETAASDVVHACTALLTEHTVAETSKTAASGFWAAVKALDCCKQDGLKHFTRGIEMAKLMQQAIIRDGGIMTVDRRLMINPAAHMQELLLNTLAPTNAREFRHPLTLLRLAYFVRDATRVARKGSGYRACNFPILVVGPEDPHGFCLVIGLRAKELAGNELQHNIFGATFQELLNHPDSVTKWDKDRACFDRAVVYVHKDTVQNFCSDVREVLLKAKLEAEEAARKVQQQTQQQQQTQPQEQQEQQPQGHRPGRRQRHDTGGSQQQQSQSTAGAAPASAAHSDGAANLAATQDEAGADDVGSPAEVVMGSENDESDAELHDDS